MLQSQGSGWVGQETMPAGAAQRFIDAAGRVRLIRKRSEPRLQQNRISGPEMPGLRRICLSACLAACAAVATAEVYADEAEPPQNEPPAPAAVAVAAEPAEAPTATPAGAAAELDRAHDWLYRTLQNWIEQFDQRFAKSGQEPLAVPPSMLRIDLQGSLIHQRDGTVLLGATDLEATLHLPNIERSLRLFITSEDLQESPGPLVEQPSSIRAGLRMLPATALSFELGVRAKLLPSAFSALKWAPQLRTDWVNIAPLAKLYAESSLGYGASSGIALEHGQQLWIVRSTSYLNWLHSTSGVSGWDWSETIITGYAPGIIREQQYGTVASGRDLACGAVLRLYAAGDQRSHSAVREASLVLKRPLHGGWLFGYLEPVVSWERIHDWHPDAGVRLGFDMLFWNAAASPGGIGTGCH